MGPLVIRFEIKVKLIFSKGLQVVTFWNKYTDKSLLLFKLSYHAFQGTILKSAGVAEHSKGRYVVITGSKI
jgi:hypothetical protein